MPQLCHARSGNNTRRLHRGEKAQIHDQVSENKLKNECWNIFREYKAFFIGIEIYIVKFVKYYSQSMIKGRIGEIYIRVRILIALNIDTEYLEKRY